MSYTIAHTVAGWSPATALALDAPLPQAPEVSLSQTSGAFQVSGTVIVRNPGSHAIDVSLRLPNHGDALTRTGTGSTGWRSEWTSDEITLSRSLEPGEASRVQIVYSAVVSSAPAQTVTLTLHWAGGSIPMSLAYAPPA